MEKRIPYIPPDIIYTDARNHNLMIDQLYKEYEFVGGEVRKVSKRKFDANEQFELVKRRKVETNPKLDYLHSILKIIPLEEWESDKNWRDLGNDIFNYFEGNIIVTLREWKLIGEKIGKYDEDERLNYIEGFKKTGDANNLPFIEDIAKKENYSGLEEIRTRFGKEKRIPLIHRLDIEDPYRFTDFVNDFNGIVFNSEGEMKDKISEKLCRVCVRIEVEKIYYIIKYDCSKESWKAVNKTREHTTMAFYYKKEKILEEGHKTVETVRVTYNQFVEKYKDMVPVCRVLVDKANDKDVLPGEFNTRKTRVYSYKYVAKLLENYDTKVIQPMLDFIKEVWANNNEEDYIYLLNWLRILVTKPLEKTDVAIFGYSKRQGTGKGTLTNFLTEYVIGLDLTTTISDLEGVTQKHNSSVEGKKLVVIDEIALKAKRAAPMFNKMKFLITEPNIGVEPKGSEHYNAKNLANFFLLSNNLDSLYLEGEEERRYHCVELSEARRRDRKYFAELRNKCFNENCGNHFYTYLHKADIPTIDVGDTPTSKLKKRIVNKKYNTSVMEFFIKMKDDVMRGVYNEKNCWRTASELYDSYKTFCESLDNDETVGSKTFCRALSDRLQKKKSSSSCYNVMTVTD